ncbi:MAG: hypothetical protein GXP55_23940 [Deltaproteobacteria bacterium]|nr:hypothetical protein [Deltaproteobacteria bacterium]
MGIAGTLTDADIRAALARLGALALRAGAEVRLVAVGGAVMVLKYRHREATKDVDAIFDAPHPTAPIRRWAALVATELSLPADWLNDGAKGFVGESPEAGEEIFSAPGIRVMSALPEVLVASKLAAFRDAVDRSDARRILQDFTGSKLEAWRRIEPHVRPTAALTKACYAFEEIWEEIHGND